MRSVFKLNTLDVLYKIPPLAKMLNEIDYTGTHHGQRGIVPSWRRQPSSPRLGGEYHSRIRGASWMANAFEVNFCTAYRVNTLSRTQSTQSVKAHLKVHDARIVVV